MAHVVRPEATRPHAFRALDGSRRCEFPCGNGSATSGPMWKIANSVSAALLLSGCAVTIPLAPEPNLAPTQAHVRQVIADKVLARMGPKWVPVAVQIAWIESRFNPNAIGPRTRHGHAVGTFQLLPSSARGLGYSPSRLRETDYGIEAGIAHMQSCLAVGVNTPREMAACHVAGPYGWNRRLRSRSARYRADYVRLVLNAPH